MAEEYGRELERVRKARAEFETTQDEVERRKQEYFDAVSVLHDAGMPLREIAAALGLSHQRVHQMIDAASGKKGAALRRRAARAAKQGGLALLVILLGITGFFTLRPELSPLNSSDEVTRVGAAPSPSGSHGGRDRRHEPLENAGHGCAFEIFAWHERNKDAAGRSPAITLKPHCVIEEVRKRSHRLQSRLEYRARHFVITIDRQA